MESTISGGLTFATSEKPMGERFNRELSKLVNYNEVQYQRDVDTIRKEVEIIEESNRFIKNSQLEHENYFSVMQSIKV